MTTSKPRILLVEDDAPIRKFLRISLQAHDYEVLECRLGEQGLEMCASEQPDVVILDLGLPDIDGQRFIQRLREWSVVPIIVLSVRASEREKVEALDSGANDYVTKPFGINELLARLRAVLRASDGVLNAPAVFESNGLRVDFALREVSVDGKPLHLSRKEYDLLRALVGHPSQVLTHQQILREVWGDAPQGETQSLRVLVGQLRHKLGDDPTRPRFVMTVQGVGYRLRLESG